MHDIYRPLISKSWLAAACETCGQESPPLCFDHNIGVWPSPLDLLKTQDKTNEVVARFKTLGWLIEHKKATCPECQGKAA